MALRAFLYAETGPLTTHFWGPVANWGLVASAGYDAYFKGPEIISMPMTLTMIGAVAYMLACRPAAW